LPGDITNAILAAHAMSDIGFPCPCCGYPTLPEPPPGTYFICPICNWEDDSVQHRDPSFAGGANTVSLHDARANFETLGVSDPRHREHVRRPTEDEARNRVAQPATSRRS
jgi:hypothetical protein